MSDSTTIIVNAKAVRRGGDHTIKVSEGLGGGICLTLSPQVVAGIGEQDGGQGVAWFIDRTAAHQLWSAITLHMGE